MELINKPEEEDLPSPKPWERGPISEARWLKHRDTMLQQAYPGLRPQEWWLYERNMQQPDQPSVWLYDHGELSGTELEVLLPHWRGKYEHSWQPNFLANL